MIRKLDPSTPCLFKTGAGTLSIKAGTRGVVADRLLTVTADSAVTMPVLTAGADYAVYMLPDGRVVADANFTAPAGYAPGQVLRIGGFHFSAGGNATAQAGGDSTPAINPYSIWDEKFRPACPDPRGMALVAGAFWSDIYLCNTAPDVNGSSKFGATIADGSSPAKVPALFGGNGTTAYGSLTWYEACELAAAYGKRLPTLAEFCAAAYGVTEATSVGADPGVTGLDAPRTSKWGLMQAAGNMWIWGMDTAVDPNSTTAGGWNADTNSRGSSYTYGAGNLHRALFGACWSDGAYAGSRAANWINAPSTSGGDIGARFLCDHLCLP